MKFSFANERVLAVVAHPDDADSTVADVVGSLTISRELAQALDGLRVREVALEQALRGEAVARIARVVGHDIQSLLTAISLTSELIARRGDSEEVRLKAAQTIFEATEAAMRLSRQLLTVAGRPETSGGPRVLDDAIQRFLPALRGLAGADRLLEIELGQPGAVVPMDRTQIEQVLLNLVVNARDATSAGGRILVRTRASARSEPRSLTLEVEDDGAGMDEATRARIFDPYFSTKDRGTNSGLGLASVRGIVASAGGEVSVRSAPGEGATFSCRVPIMEARPITAS